MKPIFHEANVESLSEFCKLARGGLITIYYVYDSCEPTPFDFDLPEVEDYELYLAFNLREHGTSANEMFRKTQTFRREDGGFRLLRLPYWGAFVLLEGFLDMAHSIEAARALVHDARREARMLLQSDERAGPEGRNLGILAWRDVQDESLRQLRMSLLGLLRCRLRPDL